MSDPTPVPAPFSRRSAVLHIALGIIAMLCLLLTRVPQLAAYNGLLTSLVAVIGTAAGNTLGFLRRLAPSPWRTVPGWRTGSGRPASSSQRQEVRCDVTRSARD